MYRRNGELPCRRFSLRTMNDITTLEVIDELTQVIETMAAIIERQSAALLQAEAAEEISEGLRRQEKAVLERLEKAEKKCRRL